MQLREVYQKPSRLQPREGAADPRHVFSERAAAGARLRRDAATEREKADGAGCVVEADAVTAQPEIALFRALAEAIQSRLTLIAGVRDDILPSYYARARPARARVAAGQAFWRPPPPQSLTPEAIAARLADRGCRQVAFRRLDDGLDGVAVTKAFVPGLGSVSRTRRPAQ